MQNRKYIISEECWPVEKKGKPKVTKSRENDASGKMKQSGEKAKKKESKRHG